MATTSTSSFPSLSDASFASVGNALGGALPGHTHTTTTTASPAMYEQFSQPMYEYKQYGIQYGTGLDLGEIEPKVTKPDFVPDLRAEIKEWLKDALV